VVCTGLDAYQLSLLQFGLQSESFCVKIRLAPVRDLMDTAVDQVFLDFVKSQKLAEAVVRG
jgi:hypothetical protein